MPSGRCALSFLRCLSGSAFLRLEEIYFRQMGSDNADRQCGVEDVDRGHFRRRGAWSQTMGSYHPFGLGPHSPVEIHSKTITLLLPLLSLQNECVIVKVCLVLKDNQADTFSETFKVHKGNKLWTCLSFQDMFFFPLQFYPLFLKSGF